MGVYIKSMEMPKSCRDCDFMNWGAVEPNRCGITDCFIGGDYDKRHDNCPLAPVQPHGRLIDADAFIEENEYFADRDFNNPRYDTTLRELVGTAPTIIPADPAEEGE